MKWFEDAVKIDPRNAAVLTSIAEIRSDQWDGGADQLVAEALEADPKYIPAMVPASASCPRRRKAGRR